MSFVPEILLLLAPVAFAPAQDRVSETSDEWRARIEDVVARGSSAAGRETMARDFVALGPRAIPALLAALAKRPTPADGKPNSALEADPVADALLIALAQMPSVKLRTVLEECIASDSSTLTRCAVLRCLGRAGTAHDLALLARASMVSDECGDQEIERALVRALLDVMARDSATCPGIESVYPNVLPGVRPSFLRALGLRADDAALRCLSRLLPIDAELRPRILVEMGRAAAKTSRPVDEDILANVRRYSSEQDSSELPEAVLTIGQLDDCESIPQLIALLSSESRGMRANALWSLQRITGLGIRDTPDRWLDWYATEKKWWTDEWPTVAMRLRGADRTRARVALAQLGPHRLERHRLALEVASLLQLEDLDTQSLACRVLAQLGSRAAVPALISALEHESTVVRTSAWTALRTITGRNLPLDAALWRADQPSG